MRTLTRSEMKAVGGGEQDVIVVTGKRIQSDWEKQMILDALQPDYTLTNDDLFGIGGGGGGDQSESDPEKCAGYDGDGDGQADAAPVGVDQMRDAVAANAESLRNLANTAFPAGAVEFGAFLIRDAGGDVRMSAPFTSGNSDDILVDDIEAAARSSMGTGDTLVGFIHTQHVSGTANASLNDALATLRTLPGAAAGAGASTDSSLMNYIIGPNGEVQEYSKAAILDTNRETNGTDLEDARGGGSCG
ncbi:MAG: hypothetical protein RIA71_00265 [Oceanicaulis sp.]